MANCFGFRALGASGYPMLFDFVVPFSEIPFMMARDDRTWNDDVNGTQ